LGEAESVINLHSHRSGNLSVEKQGDRLILDFPKYDLEETVILKDLTEAVGAMPKQVWETQGNMAMLLLQSENEVANLNPDMAALSRLKYDEVIVTSRSGDGEADFVSRLFAPRIGIPEDPVTGAIHCSLIPYWAAQLGKEKLYARQLSARGGELYCELAGNRVKIGGNAVLYMKGEIYV
jgi:predicted PhzF superfamily epimerase YddE/YHI9